MAYAVTAPLAVQLAASVGAAPGTPGRKLERRLAAGSFHHETPIFPGRANDSVETDKMGYSYTYGVTGIGSTLAVVGACELHSSMQAGASMAECPR